ncbi:hypothetical protein [Stutzerimonas nitrititolerans]|uniref:hypothetical protein n=1 Tax=Stutzerimonas nitrititolerans TaxID=2482751 RepID=UPI0028ABDD44|nr:hypothetical protein [Stutzerimonas nitrititolerans]
MAVNSADFLSSAGRFSKLSDDEIIHRTVISRAYYGLYHCALTLADSVKVPPISACVGGTHEKVSGFYQDYMSGDRTETRLFRKIGINLLRLHGQRVKADYKLAEDVACEDAAWVLQSCTTLHQEIETYGALLGLATPVEIENNQRAISS